MQAIGTVGSEQVVLRAATSDDLVDMMSWFPDAASCRIWGGPEFRFPFSEQSFQADSRFAALPSYVYATHRTLIGFGQYYLRAGRCHVSRLAVSPALRGQGWGSQLLCALIGLGSVALGVDQCSLFVAADNHPAARLYQWLGFVETPYPGPEPASHDILYLTAAIRAVRRPSSLVPDSPRIPET
jgi:ribosomal protein S18 acetylase RimI-like enzyme